MEVCKQVFLEDLSDGRGYKYCISWFYQCSRGDGSRYRNAVAHALLRAAKHLVGLAKAYALGGDAVEHAFLMEDFDKLLSLLECIMAVLERLVPLTDGLEV